MARLAALGRVFVLFGTPLCLLQSVVFGLTVTGFGAPIGRLHGISAHFLTVLLTCAFVFCALIAVQCLLLVMFGRRAAQAASMTFQVLFAVGLVQLLFFLPELSRVLRTGGTTHEGIAALAAFPPAWFFAVYEQLAGTATADSAALARVAAGVTLAAAVLAPALYGASYSYLSQRALEGPAMRAAGIARTNRARARLARSVSRPLAGAIRWFTLRTLFRSRSHRMMFAVYAGFALAIDVSSALSLALRKGLAGFQEPGPEMMSMPLVVQFLLLAALRVITAVPSDPKARWVFRACEPADRPAAVAGARDAMIVLVVLPTTVMALVQGLFWPVGTAVAHAAFVFVLGRLLAELLTPQNGKLPFACTYFPGKSRIFVLWPCLPPAVLRLHGRLRGDRSRTVAAARQAGVVLPGRDARGAGRRLHPPPRGDGPARTAVRRRGSHGDLPGLSAQRRTRRRAARRVHHRDRSGFTGIETPPAAFRLTSAPS